MFAFNQVDLAVLDCRDLGESFVVEKALAELFGAELYWLGNEYYVGRHGDDSLQARSLVACYTRFFGCIDSTCGSNDTALRRAATGGPDGIGILGQRQHPGLWPRCPGDGHQRFISIPQLSGELYGTVFLAVDVTHEEDVVYPGLGALVQVGLDYRDAKP